MKSNGTVGEQYAIIAFKCKGWTMQRTQPETKHIAGNKLIPMPSDGVPDFTGFDHCGKYIACEVKECDDKKYPPSMPCSRLSKEQHEWMESKRDVIGKYVLVFWQKLGYATLFPYKKTGSYKLGTDHGQNI